MAKTSTRSLLIRAGLLILLMWFLASWYSLPGNEFAFMAKTGKVIDGATGKGIPNIPVIASADMGGHNLMGSGFDHKLYRIITRTDADGVYHIPSTWSSAEGGIIGSEITTTWVIIPFKIGYAIVGDDDALRPDASGVVSPNSTWFSPKAHFGLPEVHIEPIVMRAVSLSDSEAAWYYVSLIGFPALSDRMKPEELALRRIAYDYFAPKICSMDPQQPLTWGAGGFTDKLSKYDAMIIKIQKDAEKKTPGTGKAVSRLAGSECAALMAGEEGRQ